MSVARVRELFSHLVADPVGLGLLGGDAREGGGDDAREAAVGPLVSARPAGTRLVGGTREGQVGCHLGLKG